MSRAPAPAGALDLRDAAEGVTLRVRVQPRAAREAVVGERGGALLVRVTAAPVEGAANAALLRLLGRALRVPVSRLELVRGSSGRDKLLRVRGLTARDLRDRVSGKPPAA